MQYIIGLGNYLMYDDSIGIRIVDYISDNGLAVNFYAICLAQDCMSLISYFVKETKKIIIIDAGKLGISYGDYLFIDPDKVTPEKVSSDKKNFGLSSHESDIIKIIKLARQNKCHMPKMLIMCIEPKLIKPEIGVSSILEKNICKYANKAIKKLETF